MTSTHMKLLSATRPTYQVELFAVLATSNYGKHGHVFVPHHHGTNGVRQITLLTKAYLKFPSTH